MTGSLAPKEDFILPAEIFLGAATMQAVLRAGDEAHRAYSATRALGCDVAPVYASAAQDVRVAMGRLFDAGPSVFFSGSSTAAKATVAQGLRLAPQDLVIVAGTPYSGPWFSTPARLQEVEASTGGYLQALQALRRGARGAHKVLVCCGAVHYATGRRLDVPAIYEAVQSLPEHLTGWLMADVSQWWGAFSAASFADAIFTTGSKWLAADHGISPTWLNLARLPLGRCLFAPHQGWGNRQAAPDDVSLLEPGGKPWGPLWSLRQSARYLLDLGGLPAMQRHIAPLVELGTALLCEGGLPVISPAEARWQSGNICIGLASVEQARDFRERLRAEQGVVVSDGGGAPRVRVTPSVFTDEAELREAVRRITRLWRSMR